MIGGPMKSLFKSGARELKSKFGKADEEELDTPLNLRIGAAVDIDTLPLRMHADNLQIKLPDETVLIVAQGFVDLGDDSYVHRFYAGDDSMIQVMTTNGTEDQHVQEITLYMPFKSYYPNSVGEWAQWTERGGRLGAVHFQLDDGTQYERIWFDTTEGHADPVEFTEYIYDDPDSDECSENFQQTMLFGRNLEADKKNEYLLLIVDSYGNEKTVEVMIGVDIALSQLNII